MHLFLVGIVAGALFTLTPEHWLPLAMFEWQTGVSKIKVALAVLVTSLILSSLAVGLAIGSSYMILRVVHGEPFSASLFVPLGIVVIGLGLWYRSLRLPTLTHSTHWKRVPSLALFANTARAGIPEILIAVVWRIESIEKALIGPKLLPTVAGFVLARFVVTMIASMIAREVLVGDLYRFAKFKYYLNSLSLASRRA